MKWGNRKVSTGAFIAIVLVSASPFGLLYACGSALEYQDVPRQVVKYTGVCGENSTVPPCRKKKKSK